MPNTSLPPQDKAASSVTEAPKRRWLARIFKAAAASERETTQSRARENMMNAADRFHILRVEDVMVPAVRPIKTEKLFRQ